MLSRSSAVPARGGHSGTGHIQTARTMVRQQPAKHSHPGGARSPGHAGQGIPLLGQQAGQGTTVKDVKERTVRVTLPRSTSFTRMDLAEAIKREDIPLAELEAIGTRQANHQWFLTFKQGRWVTRLLAQGVLQVSGKTGYISSLDDRTHRMRIHWAPYHLSPMRLTEALKEALPEGASLLSTGWEKSQISGLEHAATLVRYAVIDYDGDSADLPHILKLSQYQESFELLLTIQGRQPICLRCRQVGHMRSQCITCNLCGSHSHITARCVYTYAGKVAGRGQQEGEQPMEEADAEAEEGSTGGGGQKASDAAQPSLEGEEFPPLQQDLAPSLRQDVHVPETQDVIPDSQPISGGAASSEPPVESQSLLSVEDGSVVAPPAPSVMAALVDSASENPVGEDLPTGDLGTEEPINAELATGDLVLESSTAASGVNKSPDAMSPGLWASPSDSELVEVQMAFNQVRPTELEESESEDLVSDDSSGNRDWSVSSCKKRKRKSKI